MPQILIIEDSPDTAAIIEAVLSKSGFSFHTANTGRKALELLRLKKVKPDLVLLDIQLPDLSGYEVCEELQADEDWALIPVVFLTGSEQRESRLRAFQLGAVGFLTKPIIADYLLEQVRKALEARQQWMESFSPLEEPAAAAPKVEQALPTVNKPSASRTQPLEERLAELSSGSRSLQLTPQHAKTGPLRPPAVQESDKALIPVSEPRPSLLRAHTTGQLPTMQAETGLVVPPAQAGQDKKIQGSFAGMVMFLVERTGKEPKLNLTPENLYDQAAVWGLNTAQLARLVAEYTGLVYLTKIEAEQVKPGVLPVPFCRKYQVVPLQLGPEQLGFALPHPYLMEVNDVILRHPKAQRMIADPSMILSLFEGGELRKKAAPSPNAPVLAPVKPEMADLMDELQTRYGSVLDEIDFSASEEDISHFELSGSSDAPMVRLVNQIIEESYRMRASDIHLEAWEDAVVVRFRIDGELKDIHVLRPVNLIQPLVGRIKIMANLNIAERRLPQDGRIVFKQFSRKGPDVDLRVATAPMNFGEKVVMRLIDKQKTTLPLESLGLSKRNLELYRTLIRSPYGMVLHVGPTGSGKSMTLYSALNEINRPELNIQTAEDPIEYTLPRINQMQVQPEIGLTFARALRSYLRQDPDVILVGEIRDRETAHIAIEAALTGHLLLSTLHTNDAPTTLTRFLEMGIEPFMISPSVLMICAQRLMRRLCEHCREPYSASEQEKQQLGLPLGTHLSLYRPGGCEKCNGEGYYGRIGVHELLVPTEKIRAALAEPGMTADKLKRIAVAEGMTTLYWDAMDKVRQGISTISEALARIQPDDFDSRPNWLKEQSW